MQGLLREPSSGARGGFPAGGAQEQVPQQVGAWCPQGPHGKQTEVGGAARLGEQHDLAGGLRCEPEKRGASKKHLKNT